MYTERNYVTELKTATTALLQELEAELTKQGRRPNRESEKRTRKILASFYGKVYRPYKKASLEDLKTSSDSQNVGV